MKIILLQDVAKIGKRSEIVNVPDGYAMNQLIPKKMAEPATPANLKRVEKLQTDLAQAESADKERFESLAESLKDTKLVIETEVNEQGHLFKAISPKDIVGAASAAGLEVNEALIVINEPIKSVGEHSVELMRGSQKATFTIEVVKKAA